MRIRHSPDRTADQLTASWAGAAREADTDDALREPAKTGDRNSGGRLGRRKSGRSRRPGKRTGFRRFVSWRKALACVIVLCALVTGAFTVLYVAIDIPRANDLAKAQSNVFLYSDGSRLARTGEINRETVPLDRVPKDVRYAFVAAENKDFYSDSGISLTGTARGIVNTLTGQGTQGGSTITQQYVKNYYLSQEQTVTRKLKELVISLKVDRSNTKDDILAGYLNSSYYGRLAYGIQAAARAYYGKEVEDLTVEQGAYLAALLQAPSQYDWAIAAPEAKRLVQQRWGYVLDNMVGEGWLDKNERQRMRFPVPLAPQPGAGLSGQAGYLVDAARRELTASGISEQELAGGGWRITLNIEPDKQRALEQAVRSGDSNNNSDSGRQAPSGASAQDPNRQAGAVSVDPRTGRIVALYGGRDYMKHYLSNATRSDYQAGATFEPIAYAAVMEAKRQNQGESGLKQIRQTAADLGIAPDAGGFTAPRATELGLMGVSPLEMAGVYASLHHEGKKVTPSIVKSAQRGEERTSLPGAVGGQAIDPGTAELVISDLAFSPVRGIGRRGGVGPEVAGRTKQIVTAASGPTDDRKAEWYIGATPDLVTTVALFGEDAKTTKQVTLRHIGDGHAARIWNLYTEQALGRQSSAVPEPDYGSGSGDEVADSGQ
ncbi:transglycosylase domain-containing protein [Streptomyces sp. NPDC060064]|uniref:transglycosylase domain-containing protein n=1 Tax=Streptomyces sp. NPDC060064 TaxID=3347049 RepID=UPI0036A4ADE4